MEDNLMVQVQQLGDLRRRKTQIAAEEEALARAVRAQMVEHGRQIVRAGEYEAKLVEQERLAVRPADFMKLVTKKDLLRCIDINITTARDLLGAEKIRRISDVIMVVQLRISPRQQPLGQSGDQHQKLRADQQDL